MGAIMAILNVTNKMGYLEDFNFSTTINGILSFDIRDTEVSNYSWVIDNLSNGVGSDIDLTNNPGISNVTLSYTGNIKSINLSQKQVLSLDVSKCSLLDTIYIGGNYDLETLDLSNNPEMINVIASYTGIRNIILPPNNKIKCVRIEQSQLSPEKIDAILSQLDNNGLSNGIISGSSGRSSASDSVYTSLINKGWDLTEF
jgi:hypothetical protein